MCAAGWKFVPDSDHFEVVDAQSGERAAGIAYFAGCPWIKLQPDWLMQSQVDSSDGKCMSLVHDTQHDTSVYTCITHLHERPSKRCRNTECKVTSVASLCFNIEGVVKDCWKLRFKLMLDFSQLGV